MNLSIYSQEQIRNYITEEIIGKYKLETTDNCIITNVIKIRDALYNPIMLSEKYNIDIHSIFPITMRGKHIIVKFYQSGEVYVHNVIENTIVYLYGCYNSDSLCKE